MYGVLIIDDEEIIRRTIRRIGNWGEYGMKVVGEAEDGYAALSLILVQKPDVVFLDMRMPGLTGDEVIRRAYAAGLIFKLVVVSGFDDYEFMRTALKYGAVDYLLKPIDRDEFFALLTKLKGILDQERLSGAAEAAEQDISVPGNAIEAIYRKISEFYREPLSLETLSQEFYLSKEYLSRAFKKQFGVGITAYIHQTRLAHAKELMLKGYKISQVAEMTGYGEVNYFSRVFRQYNKMSPSEYILNHKNL